MWNISIMNYWIGLTIVGVLSGLAAGLFGAGAEILIVPLLTMLQLLPDLKNRIGTSLFMLLPPIGLFAAMKFYKKGHVDVKAALYLGLMFTVFASVSSQFTLGVDADLLRKLFGIFTTLSGMYIFFNKEV